MRDRLTERLAVFEAAFLIHDLRYADSNGSTGAFNAANDELLENCLILADRNYGWWNWRRYRARALARLIYEAGVAFGWKAWTDAATAKSQTASGGCQEARDGVCCTSHVPR